MEKTNNGGVEGARGKSQNHPFSCPIGPHRAPSSETPAFEWMLSDTKRGTKTGTKQNKQERSWGVAVRGASFLGLDEGTDR